MKFAWYYAMDKGVPNQLKLQINQSIQCNKAMYIQSSQLKPAEPMKTM